MQRKLKGEMGWGDRPMQGAPVAGLVAGSQVSKGVPTLPRDRDRGAMLGHSNFGLQNNCSLYTVSSVNAKATYYAYQKA